MTHSLQARDDFPKLFVSSKQIFERKLKLSILKKDDIVHKARAKARFGKDKM